jgi:hypothetical protein
LPATTAYAGTSRTDVNGQARDYWILGPTAGAQSLEVRVVNSTTGAKTVYGAFIATASAGAAAKLVITAGNQQDGYGAFALATSPTMQVTDAFGNPKGGVSGRLAGVSGGERDRTSGTTSSTQTTATTGPRNQRQMLGGARYQLVDGDQRTLPGVRHTSWTLSSR